MIMWRPVKLERRGCEFFKDHALNKCLSKKSKGLLEALTAGLRCVMPTAHPYKICWFLFTDPALVCLCWSAGASYDEFWFSFHISDRSCGEANVTTPGDAPSRDWTALPSWPRLSNPSLVRAPSSDPHGRTPITLRTWFGWRRPRHTQRSEAPGNGLWNGLWNSCDGQRLTRGWHVLYGGEGAQPAASQRHSEQELVGDTCSFWNSGVLNPPSWRNEKRELGSENGIVFARCWLDPPHWVRSGKGKDERAKARLLPSRTGLLHSRLAPRKVRSANRGLAWLWKSHRDDLSSLSAGLSSSGWLAAASRGS